MRINASHSPQARAKWEPIVRKQLASGLSIKKFADMEGVSSTSLFEWKRWLKNCWQQEEEKKAAAAALVIPDAESRHIASNFLPLLAEPRRQPSQTETFQEASSDRRLIEIRFPSGIELKIAISVNDSSLVLNSIRALAEVQR